MGVTNLYVRLTADELEIERRQAMDEGRALERLDPPFDEILAEARAGEQPGAAGELLDRIQELATREGFPYTEPSSLAAIREARPSGPRNLDPNLDDERLYDRVLGAWQGRCAGCLLGKPIETVPADRVWQLLREIDAFPLSAYLPADLPDALATEYGLDSVPDHNETYAESVDRMPRDDDIDYTVLGLLLLKETGDAFDAADVAEQWLSNLPAFSTYIAERVAYRNLLNGIDPPDSASHRNPFREWIGAQIRADPYGYVAVGEPALAAELAWRDARVSHVKSGLYGSMWVAAMLAAAPGATDPRHIVRAGLSEVPGDSRFAAAIETVIDWYERGIEWLDAVDRLHDRWDDRDRHDWIHTIPNAQTIALGLLWSGNDPGQAICRAVHVGFDTDCTGATVGSVMGMYRGAERIDDAWTAPLADEVETGLAARPRARISTLAEETCAVHRAIRG